MALAGTGEQVFSGNFNSKSVKTYHGKGNKAGLWKDALVDAQSLNELRHPYLRACFTFLTCDARNFKPVLDLELSLHDKVAFACRFLDDNDVRNYALLLTLS